MQLRPLTKAIPAWSRLCSSIVFGPDSGQLQEIIGRNLSKEGKVAPPTVVTTRREALGLYREILRYSRLFVWNDDTGTPWRDVLRKSARQEFETTRHHTDPELVTRLIVTGRDSVQRITEKFMEKRQDIIENEVKRTGPAP
ncbi:g5119 [Coccomyxa viridis]|uniref:G5119 protein n=1 Tax=Coccomyxa viridis TaxID=1274662 RepID=A0ABP1FTG1_9CHLO